jgi:hypothetical protein
MQYTFTDFKYESTASVLSQKKALKVETLVASTRQYGYTSQASVIFVVTVVRATHLDYKEVGCAFVEWFYLERLLSSVM